MHELYSECYKIIRGVLPWYIICPLTQGEDSGDEEEDEEDDGFFVPHGYLSDGEGEEMEHGVVPNGTTVQYKACLVSLGVSMHTTCDIG